MNHSVDEWLFSPFHISHWCSFNDQVYLLVLFAIWNIQFQLSFFPVKNIVNLCPSIHQPGDDRPEMAKKLLGE